MAWQSQSRPAVDQVSLAIKPGELFGLLGPNGAGKTTLIKILATLMTPTAGTARINGHDLTESEAVRSAITLTNGDGRSFYWRLTGRQNLEFFAALYRLSRVGLGSKIRDALKLVGLDEAADTPVRAYSTGMKQRLAIAQALLHQNPILLLDEPTRSLDPPAIRRFHDLLQEELAGRRGLTILLATHQLWEAEVLCQRVAVMHQGRLQGCGSPSELRRDLGLTERWRLVLKNLTPNLKRRLEEVALPLNIISRDDGHFYVEWDDRPPEITNAVLRVVSQEGGQIMGLSREQATLETIFTTLIQPGSPSVPTPGQDPEKTPGGQKKESPPELIIRSKRSISERLQDTLVALKSWPRVASAVLKRDFLDERSYPLALSLRFLSIFFLVTMFYFLSRLIGQSVNPYLSAYGADYFSFVLVGLGFSQYFDVGLSTFSHSLREAQTTGTLEALLVSPTRISLITISSCLWSFILATIQVLAYLVIGTALFKAGLGSFSIPTAVVIILLTFICFSSLGLIAAGFIMVFKRGDPVIWIFSTLSALLSGIYYPVEVLPGWLKRVAYLLPNTYALEAVRKLLFQEATFAAVKEELFILILFCLVLTPLGLLFFRLAVHRAKVDGSLTHY